MIFTVVVPTAVLPMAVAWTTAVPVLVPEVSVVVALPLEVVVPERKASTLTNVFDDKGFLLPETVTVMVCCPRLSEFAITFSTWCCVVVAYISMVIEMPLSTVAVAIPMSDWTVYNKETAVPVNVQEAAAPAVFDSIRDPPLSPEVE
jgi:hypothetical protein